MIVQAFVNSALVVFTLFASGFFIWFEICRRKSFYYRQARHNESNPSLGYWRQEKAGQLLALLVLAIACVCVLLTWCQMSGPTFALIVGIPLSFSVYRTLYRSNYHRISGSLVTAAAVLLYGSSLLIRDRGAQLFIFDISGDDLAAELSAVSPLIGKGIIITVLLKVAEEVGKSWVTKSPRFGGNGDVSQQRRFLQTRQAVLTKKRRHFLLITVLCMLLSMGEIGWAVVDAQPEAPADAAAQNTDVLRQEESAPLTSPDPTSPDPDESEELSTAEQIADPVGYSRADTELAPHIADPSVDMAAIPMPGSPSVSTGSAESSPVSAEPADSTESSPDDSGDDEAAQNSSATSFPLPLMVYSGSLSLALCLLGLVFSAYMPEESLDKAELDYLAFYPAALAGPDIWDKADHSRCCVIRFLRFCHSLWYKRKAKAGPAVPWLYSTLESTDAVINRKTATLWADWADYFQVYFHLLYSSKDLVSHHEFEAVARSLLQDFFEYQTQHLEKGFCMTRGAMFIQDIHRAITENFFSPIKPEDMSFRNRRARVSAWVLQLLEDRSRALAARGESLSPLTLFEALCGYFDDAVKWQYKQYHVSGMGLPLRSIFQLVIADIAGQYSFDPQGHIAGSPCILNWLCLNQNCTHNKREDAAAFHNKRRHAICRVLLLFPSSVSCGMSAYTQPEARDLFCDQEYQRFFEAIRTDVHFQLSKDNFDAGDFSALSEELLFLKGSPHLAAFASVWHKYDEQCGGNDPRTTESLRTKVACIQAHYSTKEIRETLFACFGNSGWSNEEISSIVVDVIKLLDFLTLNDSVSVQSDSENQSP